MNQQIPMSPVPSLLIQRGQEMTRRASMGPHMNYSNRNMSLQGTLQVQETPLEGIFFHKEIIDRGGTLGIAQLDSKIPHARLGRSALPQLAACLHFTCKDLSNPPSPKQISEHSSR